MDIPEAATAEYLDLDLRELVRQIKAFLKPYSFVRSARLYHGANKAKYHIVFQASTVPEEWDKIQEAPPDQRSNAEKLKDFFKIEKPVELPTEPKTPAELYADFCHNIQWPVLFSLDLDKVYRRGVGPKPLGPAPYDDRPLDEWDWSINDIKSVDLHDLVQSGIPVVLFEKRNAQEDELIAKEEERREVLSHIGRLGGSRAKTNVVLIAALRYIFQNKPELRNKSASQILRHIKTVYPDTNPLRMAKGKLCCVDNKIETHFKGKDKRVARSTFDKYVTKIKKEYKKESPR